MSAPIGTTTERRHSRRLTKMVGRAKPHPLIHPAIARAAAAGFGTSVTVTDGHNESTFDVTGFYRHFRAAP